MKTITITVPEELDRRAASEARRRGVSKSELFRQGVSALLPERELGDTGDEDPLIAWAGFGGVDITVAPGEIDEVVYDGR